MMALPEGLVSPAAVMVMEGEMEGIGGQGLGEGRGWRPLGTPMIVTVVVAIPWEMMVIVVMMEMMVMVAMMEAVWTSILS